MSRLHLRAPAFVLAAVVSLAVLTAVGPPAARADAPGGTFSAIAYSESTGQFGYTHGYSCLEDAENDRFIVVDGPADIPAQDTDGLWLHPVSGKLHVHAGEPAGELKLLR